ncbi:hypothetical protein DH2020_034345 [Rehmannia glutinosa]|uniref:DUF547 domain-containing protein n=1 Tax=Rehmannia glutinosa TaxID=99300 RepID=A0ABR0VA94_REHGL
MGHLKKFEPKKRQMSSGEAQCLLKEEPAEDLIKEIALLELEIIYLEKYLLSMYRRKFAKRLSTLPRVDEKPETNDEIHIRISSEVAKTNLEPVKEEDSVISYRNFVSRDDSANVLPTIKCNDILGSDTLIDSGIFRSHSSLSQHSACSFRMSPTFETVAEGVDAYHSLPLSMLERIQDSSSNANQAECNASSFPGRVCETLNWLSEEMIKCISTVYCHLSDRPLSEHHDIYDLSSSENQSFDSWMNNPFHLEASNEFSGSLFTMVEIHGLFRDSQRLNDVEDLLQNYRSLISKLAQVDPGKLRHEEKLAFWINIHNALVMHAFMVYGIPRGNLKRISLVLKAAYNIGGHTISVDTIQSSILGCRLPRPTPWLHSLFFPKKKFKAGDPRKAFAVKQSEPRLHFALCSGCQSDPAVRLYTPKKVFQELEMAKEDYIQMNINLHKEQRLLVPKNVEYFIKEMGLSTSGIAEMIEHSMPHSLANNFQGKLWKKVDWIPHNFTFRFLLSNELVR